MKPHEVSNILSKHYALMLTTCMRRVAEIIHLKPDDGRMELVLLELRLKPKRARPPIYPRESRVHREVRRAWRTAGLQAWPASNLHHQIPNHQNRLFFVLASRSDFGAAVSEAVARSSIMFCNSVSANCIGMPASRLLGAAAACVILLSFAAEDCKSYWGGCIQVAIVICQQIFAILAIVIFLLKFLLKSASKSSFCRFGVEIRVLEPPLRVVLLCFATQSLQIAL